MKNSIAFPQFPDDCNSLLSKHLSKAIYMQLKDKKTGNGFTLDKAINSGIKNLDSGVGAYAGDAESYTLFSSLFDPIIEAYHGFSATDTHIRNLNPSTLIDSNPDPENKFIVSTRIRVGRNIAGFPLGPAISGQQRNEIEKQVSAVLIQLEGELEGSYYPLLGMSEIDRKQLIADHFLFKSGDRFLEAAGLNRDWPEGRGIYHNNDKTFLVWLNEEDQLRIISMQMGGDICAVYNRLYHAINKIESVLEFAYSKRLGYISSCPTNLGTAMRASVHIKLPRLAVDMAVFKQIADHYHLQIRGVHGEHSASEGGIFDISNQRRLGVTEVECAQAMIDGVTALIAMEKTL